MSDPTMEPTTTVEAPQEQRPETLAPEKRAELMKQSEELQKAAADAEARKQEAVAAQARDEAEATTVQERINTVLGKHDILTTIREEDKALIAVYERQVTAANNRRAAIDAKLIPESVPANDTTPPDAA